VASIALYLNYDTQHRANRPELVLIEATLSENPTITPSAQADLTWANVGQRSAQRGTATLFTVSNDGARREKFEKSQITAVSRTTNTTLTPVSRGTVHISPDMRRFLGLFLACVEYYDEKNNSYEQTFLLRVGIERLPNGAPPSTITPIDELPSSTHQVCNHPPMN
jgi:hypothetical protein